MISEKYKEKLKNCDNIATSLFIRGTSNSVKYENDQRTIITKTVLAPLFVLKIKVIQTYYIDAN